MATKKKPAKKKVPAKAKTKVKARGKKVKLKKYPKEPRRTASVEVLKTYFKRCADVDRENAKKLNAEKLRLSLVKKLQNHKHKY